MLFKTSGDDCICFLAFVTTVLLAINQQVCLACRDSTKYCKSCELRKRTLYRVFQKKQCTEHFHKYTIHYFM